MVDYFENVEWNGIKCSLDYYGVLTINTEGSQPLMTVVNNKNGDVMTIWDNYNLNTYVTSVVIQGYIEFVEGTSLQKLFHNFNNCESFSGLEKLNTTNVTNMTQMFGMDDGVVNEKLKTLNLSSWNTANVTNMSYMFKGCNGLTSINISNFKTSSVTNMQGIFYGCSSLTSLGVSKWNTANVTNMADMFRNCRGLTKLIINNWNTANVTKMTQMFDSCLGLTSLDLSGWSVTKTKNIAGIFNNCTGLASIVTPKEFDRSNFFKAEFYSYFNGWYDTNGNQLTNSINVKTNTTYSKTKAVDGKNKWYSEAEDSCYWKLVDNILTIYSEEGHNVGYNASNLINQIQDNISNITKVNITGPTITFKNSSDPTKLTDLSSLFVNFTECESINGLENFDTTNVVYMNNMFWNCSKLTSLNLSSFVTSNVTDMSWMFNGCSGLTSLDLSSFEINTYYSVNVNGMFYDCSKLTYITTPSLFSLTDSFQIELYARYPNLNDIGVKVNSSTEIKPKTFYFTKLPRWSNNLDNSCYWSYSKNNKDKILTIYSSGDDMKANDASELRKQFTLDDTILVKPSEVTKVEIKCSIKFVENTKLTSLFQNFTNCESINGLENFDTTNVVNMSYMFDMGYDTYNDKLKTLDVKTWNIDNVTEMSCMFQNCKALTSLNLFSWDLAKVGNITDMLKGLTSVDYIVTPYQFDDANNFQTELYNKINPLYGLDGSKVKSSTEIQTSAFYFTKLRRWSNTLDNSCYWSYNKNDKILTIYSSGDDNKANNASELKDQFELDNIVLVDPKTVFKVEFKDSIDFVEGTDLSQLFYNFYNCESFDGLENLDTTEVTNMNQMFGMDDNTPNKKQQTLNLNDWNTINVTNMSEMFNNFSGLTSLDLSSWNVTKVEYAVKMFKNCNGLNYIITPKEFDTSDLFITELYGLCVNWYDIYGNQLTNKDNVKTTMIYRKDETKDVDSLPKWYDKAEDSCYWKLVDTILTIFSMKGHNVGYNASDLKDQIQNNISNIAEVNIIGPTITFKNSNDTTQLTDLSTLFANFTKCKSINGLENFDTTNVGNMDSMFFMLGTADTKKLETLNVSNWNTAKVTNMIGMFYGCHGLETLNISNWNTTNVININNMFNDCSSLKILDLGSFILRNITSENNITNMLNGLTNLETIITPYQFDNNNYFKDMFISNLVGKPGSENLKNRELRDIGNLELVTEASDIKPSYVYTRKDSEVTKQIYELNDKITNILN